MEVSTSLLVALMFVTLLSMGIGNAVNTFSVIIEKGKKSGYGMIQIGWLGLLLLTYFNMFWHTVDLLAKEEWGFISFVYIMAGPMIIYFATSILIASGNEEHAKQSVVNQRFFIVFLLLQFWIITVDIILGNSILRNNVLNIMIACVVIVLIYTPKIEIQRYGLMASLGLVFLALLFRSLGLIT